MCSGFVLLTVFLHSSPRFLSLLEALCQLVLLVVPPYPLVSTARMASFPVSLIRESRLLGLEKTGFIPSREASRWRLESEGEVPSPRDDKVVMLASFYERRFGLPLHQFVCGLLHFYQLEVQNHHPNVVLHIACFITLCEAFMGINHHRKL
jgi:hypothetical protein